MKRNLQVDKDQILFQFFSSPWAATLEEETRHRYLTQKMASYPREEASQPVDEIQMMLLNMIIAFNTDNVPLEDPKLIQQFQLK